jgi:hypothetical protein
MDDLGEKVAAHDATLTQMNERLGSIDARLTSMEARMATKGELRGWAGLISGLLAIAVGIILKYG